ncbi:hypothetical protein QR64_10070 [Rhodococcus sp. Chr-9]|nr:hypothetical protein QR64_10070 [Rhodococcus sp. Chr-9]
MGNESAQAIPWSPARVGMTSAPAATPSGTDICRMPIARPRWCGGNHPTTTRPLAELALTAPAPAHISNRPSSAAEVVRDRSSEVVALASPIETAAIPSPAASARRSPNRSAIAPHTTSVNTPPRIGAPARVPAWARVKPPSWFRVGMRKATPLMTVAWEAWARTPRARISHRRRPMSGVSMSPTI